MSMDQQDIEDRESLNKVLAQIAELPEQEQLEIARAWNNNPFAIMKFLDTYGEEIK